MDVIPLGISHIQVSKLCLGAVNLGTKVDKKESFALLDRYYEAGGRFIDTANNYSFFYNGKGGESETVIGEWMKDRGIRNELVIATKVGFNTPEIGNSLSADVIRLEFEGSLRRLQTEYVDLYYAHKDHRDDPLEETLRSFHRLHRKGQVRAIGCSNYLAWRIEEARDLSRQHGWPGYCCVQAKHSYLRPRPGSFDITHPVANDDLFDYCRVNRGVLMLAYSPTLGGAYQRSDREIGETYKGADTDARLAALRKVAKDLGATSIQVVLAWMLASDPIALPLITAGTVEQMDENLGSLDVQLSGEQLEQLHTAGNPN
jgi:aryl-alcohol dehydrogenase-like predicted oxidoreductase